MQDNFKAISMHLCLTVLPGVFKIQAEQPLIVPGLADILSPAPAPWFSNTVKPQGFWSLQIGNSAKH